mmetsp:Transcript_14923/g.28402  ORF Transcript_14923/g.28402 Transcript_14923/m.28402 type:complete len:81 (-) Transcript_14923:173-415(-)
MCMYARYTSRSITLNNSQHCASRTKPCESPKKNVPFSSVHGHSLDLKRLPFFLAVITPSVARRVNKEDSAGADHISRNHT